MTKLNKHDTRQSFVIFADELDPVHLYSNEAKEQFNPQFLLFVETQEELKDAVKQYQGMGATEVIVVTPFCITGPFGNVELRKLFLGLAAKSPLRILTFSKITTKLFAYNCRQAVADA